MEQSSAFKQTIVQPRVRVNEKIGTRTAQIVALVATLGIVTGVSTALNALFTSLGAGA
jgi:hypothetical protein